MHRLILSATGVAAAVIVAVVAFGSLNGRFGAGGPPGVPFTSERHGYTVVLPEDQWKRQERPGTWALGAFFDANSPGVDYYEKHNPGRPWQINFYVYLASQPLEGLSFDEWAAGHDAANAREMPCFELQGDPEDRLVDGETARLGTHRCDAFGDGGEAWTTVQTLVTHGGRGYAIYVWPFEAGSAMPPERDIEAFAADWLARFSFND